MFDAEPGIKIPYSILMDEELCLNAKVVYSCLKIVIRDPEERLVDLTQEQIAELTMLSLSTVQRHLKELEHKGYISVEKNGRKNQYIKHVNLTPLKGINLTPFTHINVNNTSNIRHENVKCNDDNMCSEGNEPVEISHTGRPIPGLKVKKEKKYSDKVNHLFDYWNRHVDAGTHQRTSQVGKDALKELHKKMQSGTPFGEIEWVINRYIEARKYDSVRESMNFGHPIKLRNLLNSREYGGKADWYEFFLDNSIQDIIDKYTASKKKFYDPSLRDPHPEVTQAVADAYAQTFLEQNGYNLKENYSGYDQFKTAGAKILRTQEKNSKHYLFGDVNKILDFLIEALDDEYGETTHITVKPAHLCSDNTWNILFPAYITKQFPEARIDWR